MNLESGNPGLGRDRTLNVTIITLILPVNPCIQDAEANIAVAIASTVPVAVGTANIVRVVVPATATKNTRRHAITAQAPNMKYMVKNI